MISPYHLDMGKLRMSYEISLPHLAIVYFSKLALVLLTLQRHKETTYMDLYIRISVSLPTPKIPKLKHKRYQGSVT